MKIMERPPRCWKTKQLVRSRWWRVGTMRPHSRNLPIETYKAALRAYVLMSPPQEQKAIDIMQALDKAVQAGGGADASEQLTRIYIGLGVTLQKQVERLCGRSRRRWHSA